MFRDVERSKVAGSAGGVSVYRRIPTLAALAGVLTLCAGSSGAVASEKLLFQYDALGRLVRSCQSRPGTAFLTNYSLDAAGNRTSLISSNKIFRLTPGSEIYSTDGRFRFTMQSDGNLVLYGPSGALWYTNTFVAGSYADFQNDGNLVVYKGDGSSYVWASRTQSDCANLAVQSDGNVVIYSSEGVALWNTGTGGH